MARPVIFETPEDMQAIIDEYFSEEGGAYIQMGDAKMFAPTVTGLALALDIDRKTLLNYEKKSEFFPTIKRAKNMIAEALEQRLYGNTVTGIIFNLKNNFGWNDVKAVEHTGKDGGAISIAAVEIQPVAPRDYDETEED